LAVPERHRECGVCQTKVGRSRAGQPGLDRGYCPRCGTHYSFVPTLNRGDQLGQYQVVRPLAHGGVGWIYLARDTHLDDRWVVLKGLINAQDPAAVEAAVSERRYLVTLDHPKIVRILDFVERYDPESGMQTGYTVMEYVGGWSLEAIKRASRSAE